MRVNGFHPTGGRHGESAAMAHLLAHAGVVNPVNGKPLSESLCFGIAGGIGAGYSFCPSMVRHGTGSGVTIVGRHKFYVTGPDWYQDLANRLRIKTRVTETTSPAKAYRNLIAELEAGRPTVVWCSRARLPFLGNVECPTDLFMHSFVVFAVDEAKGVALGADVARGPVSIPLDALAEARAGICSHKNRTLTFDPAAELSEATLVHAIRDGIAACAAEMRHGKMRTFSLPGLEIWAKLLTSSTNKDGWLKVFRTRFMYRALRDVFDSIETRQTGGGLFRALYAEFLEEAAGLTGDARLAELSETYRGLADEWRELADAALPDWVKPFKETKALLRKKEKLVATGGAKSAARVSDVVEKLRKIDAELKADFPLTNSETAQLLDGLHDEVVALHAAETDEAQSLATCATA